MNHYLEVNNLSEVHPSAYKINYSCETSLLRVQNDFLFALDSSNCVALLTLDLSAAFNTVDHEILLERTSSKFGIKDKALAWFKSYLSDRTKFFNTRNSYTTTAVPVNTRRPTLYMCNITKYSSKHRCFYGLAHSYYILSNKQINNVTTKRYLTT